MVNCKIDIKEFDFWYGSKQVLFGVNAMIKKNKITALIGPSGCGKSTLLRCMNRMNDIILGTRLRGKMLYDGEDIYNEVIDVTDLRKKIGMVFQKPNPFPMSVFENVAYGLKISGGKNNGELKRIVEESLKRADLWDEVRDRLGESAFGLSGGQQQRLCIARSLAVNPDVILLDEPCSALDPISTSKIEKLLVKLKEDMTIIIVTHNMHQAKRISDYTIYLLNGRLIESGETGFIFNTPKNKSTQEYIRGKFG